MVNVYFKNTDKESSVLNWILYSYIDLKTCFCIALPYIPH